MQSYQIYESPPTYRLYIYIYTNRYFTSSSETQDAVLSRLHLCIMIKRELDTHLAAKQCVLSLFLTLRHTDLYTLVYTIVYIDYWKLN